MTKMQLAIPNDWDGETWGCYRIYFPNSDSWRGLFLGSLSQWYKGRLWDESTGNIKAVQAIGREIFSRNYPLFTCQEMTETIELSFLNWILDCLGKETLDELPTCEQLQSIFCNCDQENEEQDDMASVTNLKCENGILYMERCCQWIAVCNIADLVGNTTTETDIEVISRNCNFAGSFAVIVHKMLHDFASEFEVSLCGYDPSWRIQRVKMYFSSVGFDNAMLSSAISYFCSNITDIVDDLVNVPVATEGDIRCAAYNQIKTLEPQSSIVDDSFLELMKRFYTTIPYQDVTATFVQRFVASLQNDWLRSVMSINVDVEYDCTCGAGEELSEESNYHTANMWFLTAGIAGSIETASGDSVWPYAQWCHAPSEIWAKSGAGMYGVAFEIRASTASQMAIYYNPTKEEFCSGDYRFKVVAPPYYLGVGKYIICHPTMYTNLESDVADYTLIEDTSYSTVYGVPEHDNDSLGMLSLRHSVAYTGWSGHVTDFRFVMSKLDV